LKASSSTIRAPAKINLWLRIFAPDQTGYHPLDTLFCALDFADEISLHAAESGIDVVVQGAQLGAAESNLAYRAANEFFLATGISAALRIVLQKRIPAGAGLGGGSSDAASVLLALNELHGNVLPDADLMATGARIGSDVAFFMCGSPLAHATGRGEVLSALPPLPRRPLLIVAPHFKIATVDAYRWLDEAAVYEAPRELKLPNSWSDVAKEAVNSFEAVLFSRMPRLQQMRDVIRKTRPEIGLLSGSGSALFGLYGSVEQRDEAAEKLRHELPDADVIAAFTAG
jgi:4-diphosphocytidyl-2-C-methyl-D-erythritol kinase